MQVAVLAKKEQTAENRALNRVCFVCTGNTCRSPMAAALYNHLYAKEGKSAFSAGLFASFGEPIHENAKKALSLSGIPNTKTNNYEAHFAHTLSKADMQAADLVFAITPSHAMQILGRFPEFASKITVLGDIADPFGGDLDDYLATLEKIKEALA